MRKLILTSILVLLALFSVSCSSTDANNNLTQSRLDFLLALENGNYDEFNENLSSEKGILTKEEFLAIKSKTSDSSHVREFQMLQFNNGEIILLEFIKDDTTNNYKIQKVIRVPDDAKKMFQE